jgi:hypothetical protein
MELRYPTAARLSEFERSITRGALGDATGAGGIIDRRGSTFMTS